MRVSFAAALLAATAMLAGCDDTARDAPPEAIPPGVKIAKGTGVITALDAKAGRVTLDHEPMPEIGWPRMTMTFAADPALLADVEPGDRVAFDLTLDRGLGVITALAVQ